MGNPSEGEDCLSSRSSTHSTDIPEVFHLGKSANFAEQPEHEMHVDRGAGLLLEYLGLTSSRFVRAHYNNP